MKKKGWNATGDPRDGLILSCGLKSQGEQQEPNADVKRRDRSRENRAEISGYRYTPGRRGRCHLYNNILSEPVLRRIVLAVWPLPSGILCGTHTWPHIVRHGRRYLHPAETPLQETWKYVQRFLRGTSMHLAPVDVFTRCPALSSNPPLIWKMYLPRV